MIFDFGHICMELSTKIKEQLSLKSLHICTDQHMQIGGSGALQTIAAARAGARIAKTGIIGNDVFAEKILQTFRREGILTQHLLKTEKSTDIDQKITDTAGKAIKIQSTGANTNITPPAFNNNIYNERNLIILHEEMGEEFNMTALDEITNSGSRSIMSFQTPDAKTDKYLPHIDIAVISGNQIPSGKHTSDKIIHAEENGFDCFCGTLAACLQANLTLEKAVTYAKHAQRLYQESEKEGYAALPYLGDIEEQMKSA